MPMVKLSEHFQKWYETYREPKLREVSRQSYIVVINQIERDPIGDLNFKKITRKDMQGFFNRYGSTRRKTTVLDTKRFINACFADGVHDGIIKVNPVSRVEVVSVEDSWDVGKLKKMREQKKWLELDEYKKTRMYLIGLLSSSFQKNTNEKLFITNRGGDIVHEFTATTYSIQMYLTVIYIALKTGARFSEILGLTDSDICFQSKTVNIEKTWDYKYSGGFIPTKNTASIREIPIDDEFLAIIKNYLDWTEKFKVERSKQALFVKKGSRIHNATFNDLLKSIFIAIEIEPITFHKLRHTHASILLAQKVSPQVVAKRLGHTDTNMIQTTYGHLLESVENEQNSKLLELI